MNKDIRKNREALIRYFYSLNDPGLKDKENYACLCAKQRTNLKLTGDSEYWAWSLPKGVKNTIDFTESQWDEIENRFDGLRKWYEKPQTFSQIADWLQTLPGWPRVL